MRKRPLIVLSTVAAATLLLAGCSGSPAPESSSTPKADTGDCAVDLKSGKTSDAVVVEGEGVDAKVTVPSDAEFADAERTTVKKGEGDDVKVGDLVSVAYQIVDAVTGEVLDSSARGEDGVIPVLMDVNQSSLFVAALECRPAGTQVVLTLPKSVLGENVQNNLVVYAEALEELPTVANGKDVKPTEGMPEVKLDDEGEPTITIPKGDAPAETKVALLKEGDGPVVGAGDLVVVQYKGVKWSDGKEFDSSWSRDAVPAQFQTSGVVTGFRLALEGQKVGSQVVVVMPPKDGYGASAGHELEKESLVFVVDILATTPVQQAQQ